MTSVNLSIPDITWRKLGEWGKITLPGVGTFILENTPSQLDLVRNTIIASEEKITYNQHTLAGTKYDIRQANISAEWMELHYNQFISHYNYILNTDARYFFRNIGTLTNTQEGIQFSPDPDSVLIQRGKELQQIAFSPVNRTYIKQETDAPQKHSGKTKKKYSLSRLTWLALFVVVNTALIFWLVEKKRNNAEMDSLSVSLPDNRLNVKPSADAPFPDVPEIKNDSITGLDTSIASADTSTAVTPEPIIIPPTVKNEIPFFEQSTIPVKPAVPDSKPETVIPIEKSDITLAQENPDKKTAPEKSHAGKCAIIVGSFKEKTNVQKMEQRIEQAGFESYTQKSSKLTKVGIISGCEEVTTVLEFAKSNFHPDAWVHPIQ